MSPLTPDLSQLCKQEASQQWDPNLAVEVAAYSKAAVAPAKIVSGLPVEARLEMPASRAVFPNLLLPLPMAPASARETRTRQASNGASRCFDM